MIGQASHMTNVCLRKLITATKSDKAQLGVRLWSINYVGSFQFVWSITPNDTTKKKWYGKIKIMMMLHMLGTVPSEHFSLTSEGQVL